MKQMIKKVLGTTLWLSLALTGCGGGSPNNVYQAQPYDPLKNSTYVPKADTFGYDPTTPPAYKGPTFVVMKNMFLRVDPEIGVFIKDMEGELEPKRKGDPVMFDDIRSFICHVYRSQKIIDGKNITTLMNKYVFNYPDAPLKDIQVQFMPGKIKMSGKMKQIVWVPFEMEGSANAGPDGNIYMVPDKIVAAGISSKGLMDFIGLKTSALINLNAERGVKIEGNTVVMYPTKMFPPPALTGRVVSVSIAQDAFTMNFDTGKRIPRRTPLDTRVQNYQYVYGGNILIANELHRGAELQMIDMDQSNAFDFYLAEYAKHLKAGYVKVANDTGGLLTLMPDYTKIATADLWAGYPGGNPLRRGVPGIYPQ